MPVEKFFDSQTEQSEVKTEIVRKYFWSWASVMIGVQRRKKKDEDISIGYFDLFAGPGRYEDGTKSTPILILEEALTRKGIAQKLFTLFNEADSENYELLQEEIANIPNIKLLKFQPQITNREIGDSFADVINNIPNLPPSLFFLDPWGYKDISLKLIEAVLRSFGCDCIFFFNYSRVNAAITNRVLSKNLPSLFGENRFATLQEEIRGKNPGQRQNMIIQALKDALRQFGGEYSIEYFFKDGHGTKTSHFIILTSKNVKAYNIMKDIMARESSGKTQGVPSFGFNPRDSQRQQQLMFQFEDPIENLAKELLAKFKGQAINFEELFNTHNLNTTYVRANYRDALNYLEGKGLIVMKPSREKRLRGGIVTCGPNVQITFPE